MGRVIKMIPPNIAEAKYNIRQLQALIDKCKLPPEQKKEMVQKIKSEQK